jgi:DNA modification methylase
MPNNWRIIVGDCRDRLRELPDESIHMIWTSPPYFGLRDYGNENQIGLEPTPDEFVEAITEVMREARRVLRGDGTLWLNLGDSYARAGGWSNNNGLDEVSRERCTRAKTNMTSGKGSQKVPLGLKSKDLIGIPWRTAFALQADGWYLRSDIIWAKGISGQESFGNQAFDAMIKQGIDPATAMKVVEDLDLYVGNPMPESVSDRPSSAHEHLFLFSKSPKYFYDHIAVREVSASDHSSGNDFKRTPRLSYLDKDGARGNENDWKMGSPRNRRNVWCIPTKPFKGAHFATAPEALVEPCIKAGCPEGGTVLDPFAGAGTTLLVAEKLGRKSIGIELNPEYAAIATERLEAYSREVYLPADERYVPMKSEDALPDEIVLADLFGK